MSRLVEESRLAEALVFAGLLALFGIVFADIGGAPTISQGGGGVGAESTTELPLKAAQLLLDMESYGALIVPTNSSNPFYTDYFTPAKPESKEPPATRLLKIGYLGYYETQDGRRKAYLSFEGNTLKLRPGETVTGDLKLATIERAEVVLIDAESKISRIGFKSIGEIEVPNN
jgi:hypothetical protein